MLNIVLFGPPGAGKGTQSSKLVDKYNLIHLSTGDIFRYNIKNETDLGVLARFYIDKGNLVPDKVTIDMLQAEVKKNPNAKGFIFDGFPRTIPQAEALDVLMTELGTKVDLMLSLDAPEDELVERLLLRGKDSGRADDSNEEVIRNRIGVYNDQTAVAASYYDNQNKYFPINGVGSIDDIFEQLCSVIDKFN
jgi:adenylate kinase